MIRDTRRKLSFLAIDEDKIDIGTVIELAPAELAKRENGELSGRRPRGFANSRSAIRIISQY